MSSINTVWVQLPGKKGRLAERIPCSSDALDSRWGNAIDLQRGVNQGRQRHCCQSLLLVQLPCYSSCTGKASCKKKKEEQ